MNITELMNSACDKTKAAPYHNEFWTITQDELERFTALVLAAHTAKLLAGVEMPEEFTVFTEDEPNTVIHGYTADQLQQYAAEVAAQARMKALDEAMLAVNSGVLGHGECAAAIESLKGK